MNASRAYVLIDAAEGKAQQVFMTLREKPGIALVDYVEGPPDVIMVTEAAERQELADLIIQALTSVEDLIDGVQCLPVSNGSVEYISVQKRGREEGANMKIAQ